jgi:putative membrane protein
MEKKERVTLFASSLFFFVSSIPAALFSDSPNFTVVSSLFIVVMALPSYYYIIRWLGLQRGSILLTILSALPILVEAVAVSTGIPYGRFYYSKALGQMVLGLVPWSVAFAYLPILLGSVALANRLVGGEWLKFTLLSGFLTMAVDLVLEPAVVAQRLWIWANPGPYYGIPLINFGGWFLTGFSYSTVFYLLSRGRHLNDDPVPLTASSSLMLILSFWTGLLIWRGLLLPSFFGFALLGLQVFLIYGSN